MTFHDRFPHEFMRIDFVLNVIVLVIDGFFFALLLWDLIASRREKHLTMRIGTVSFVAGVVFWRAYTTYSLWHFHFSNLPVLRVYADSVVIGANILFISCWLADNAISSRESGRSMRIGDNRGGVFSPVAQPSGSSHEGETK